MYRPDDAYHNRPTRAIVRHSHLRHNLDLARSLTGDDVKIMAMVKANAYGHGIEAVSRELLSHGVYQLGVAYLEEAIFLRERGIDAPILVLGAINTEQIDDFIIHDIEITSSSLDKSKAISEAATRLGKKAMIHLKIDTGMERIGVHWYNAEKFIDETFNLPGLEVKGVFSHLARAEDDHEFTMQQISRFSGIVGYMDRRGMKPELVHLANSAGILYHPDSHFNMVRPGIMLYGYDPAGYEPGRTFNGQSLKPVMSLLSKVSYFKVVPAGTGISYGHRWVSDGQRRIVTLPLGYGDGYSRLLSNKADVIIRGKRYRQVGSICMDQCMVDIGPHGTAYNGDDVLLFGELDGSRLPLEELTEAMGTITYEFLTGISSRVPRIYRD